jgi:hypothetical protein
MNSNYFKSKVKIRCYILFTIGILFLINFKLIACNCSSIESFWQEYYKNSKQKSLIKIVKIDDFYWGMHAKVIEKHPECDIEDTITIWGINKVSCRWARTNEYNDGDTLLYILINTNLEGNSQNEPPLDIEQEGDYQLSICGCNILRLKNGLILSQITDSVLELPVDSFYNLIEQPYLSVTDYILLENKIEVFPNPATTSVTIIKNGEEDFLLKVFDLNGRMVFREVIVNSNSSIDLEALENKTFLFVFSNKKTSIIEKIVKYEL